MEYNPAFLLSLATTAGREEDLSSTTPEPETAHHEFIYGDPGDEDLPRLCLRLPENREEQGHRRQPPGNTRKTRPLTPRRHVGHNIANTTIYTGAPSHSPIPSPTGDAGSEGPGSGRARDLEAPGRLPFRSLDRKSVV